MECLVVTISRSLAAGGEEIGRLVAEELGSCYVDDEIGVKGYSRGGGALQEC